MVFETLFATVVAGASSGWVEVAASHPIDVFKTSLQLHRSIGSRSSFGFLDQMTIRQLYTGVTARLIGIGPMRIWFWTWQQQGFEYWSTVLDRPMVAGGIAGSIAGLMQTMIDQVIEVTKTRAIANRGSSMEALNAAWRSGSLSRGALPHTIRNTGFGGIVGAIVFGYQTDDPTYSVVIAGSAGLFACLPTQPFDYVRTVMQASTEKMSMMKIFGDCWREKPTRLFTGLIGRSSVGIVSMAVGYPTFKTVYSALR